MDVPKKKSFYKLFDGYNKAKIITKLYMQCFKIKKFDIRKLATKKNIWVKQHSFHFKLGNCINLC